jgi:hypothetical protein
MIERLHLSVLVLIAAVLWAALLLLQGVAVEVSWLRPISVVIGVLLLGLAAFDLYLWKLPLLQNWFVKRPFIGGTWRAELDSTWVEPASGNVIPSISGFMVIRQTFSRLSLRLLTAESQSELLGAEILRADDGTYRLMGVYHSEPRLTVRDRSPIHYGGLVLQVVGTPASTLEGHYWTDRNTSGEITLSKRRRKQANDMTSAAALYR